MNTPKMIAKATMWGVIAIAVTLMWSSSVMAGDATSIFTGYANVSPPLGTFTYIRYTPEGKPFMVMIDGFGKYNHRAVNVDSLDQEFAEADAWVKGTGAD